MRTSDILERKYLLTQSQYLGLRCELRAAMQPDEFTLRGGGSYLVRSLYFDTANLAAWRERENGNFGRIKLRLRSYSDSTIDRPAISVEIKTKSGSRMRKFSRRVGYGDYQAFLRHRSWPDRNDPVLAEFERLYRCRLLQPVVVVQYQREAWQPKIGTGLRITLDHTVHSGQARQLFPGHLILKPHRPRQVILEIKSAAALEPAWVSAMVRRHGLKATANSKYVQGIDIIRPQMVSREPAV